MNDKEHSPLPPPRPARLHACTPCTPCLSHPPMGGLEFFSRVDPSQWLKHFALAGEQTPSGVCSACQPICQSCQHSDSFLDDLFSNKAPFWMPTAFSLRTHTYDIISSMYYVHIETALHFFSSSDIGDAAKHRRQTDFSYSSYSSYFFILVQARHEIAEPRFIRARPD